MRQCFEMSYFGGFSLMDIDAMPVFERRYIFALLRETKREEHQHAPPTSKKHR